MDRVSRPQVRHGAAPGRDRDARDLRQGTAQGVRARLRAESADRARLRQARQAPGFSLDLRGLRNVPRPRVRPGDRKSTRLNSSHQIISYAVFFLNKKTTRLNSSHQIISYAVFCLKKKTTLLSSSQPIISYHLSSLNRQNAISNVRKHRRNYTC